MKKHFPEKFIVFVDIDETIFKTFAKVYVVKENKVVKKLSNKEFNTYSLKPGERFDFCEFVDGKLFKETSIPIKNVIDYLKETVEKIKKQKNGSKIIFLTARSDFLDKDDFLDAFRKQGFEIDNKDLMYIERAGNLKKGSVPDKKKKIMQKYLSKESYGLCQLFDDDEKNIKILSDLMQERKQRKKFTEGLQINFQGFLVKDDGAVDLIFEDFA